MKTILFLVFSANILVAASYVVGGNGTNGAISCCIGAAQALINYFFDRKNKPLPKWLVCLYAIAFIALNIAIGGFNLLGILAIVASLTFVMCIGQTNGAKYRIWTTINTVLWCVYDVLSRSYGALFTHVSQLLFTAIGMIIHDVKRKE